VEDLQRLADVLASAHPVELLEAGRRVPLDGGVEQLDARVDVRVLERAPEAEADGDVMLLGTGSCRGTRSHSGSARCYVPHRLQSRAE
jgi:hypothetical protein